MNQPEMFPISEYTNQEMLDRVEVSRRVVGMLSAMRRKVAEIDRERVFIEEITKCLEKTRAKGKATPTQIEGMILYAIEKQQCWTLTEICEELNMERPFIKAKILEMQIAGLVKIVKKYVPGMFKHTHLIKSTRTNEPEAV